MSTDNVKNPETKFRIEQITASVNFQHEYTTLAVMADKEFPLFVQNPALIKQLITDSEILESVCYLPPTTNVMRRFTSKCSIRWTQQQRLNSDNNKSFAPEPRPCVPSLIRNLFWGKTRFSETDVTDDFGSRARTCFSNGTIIDADKLGNGGRQIRQTIFIIAARSSKTR